MTGSSIRHKDQERAANAAERLGTQGTDLVRVSLRDGNGKIVEQNVVKAGTAAYKSAFGEIKADAKNGDRASISKSRDDEIRTALLASPNKYDAQAAACVGREGTCAVGLTAPLAGGWFASTAFGRLVHTLAGFGLDVQSLSDGMPIGRGPSGVVIRQSELY